eukprot:15366823-Ditylum_brightwellii.AAC.1
MSLLHNLYILGHGMQNPYHSENKSKGRNLEYIVFQTNRQTYRQVDRWTDRQTDRQTDRKKTDAQKKDDCALVTINHQHYLGYFGHQDKTITMIKWKA